jgi:hypothetical protein
VIEEANKHRAAQRSQEIASQGGFSFTPGIPSSFNFAK